MPGETKVLSVGASAEILDIYLSANGNPVSGKYVGFELLDAADTSVVSGVALNPELGKYTGSGIIPAGYQLGTWQIDWTIVTLSDNVLFATEPFTVQELEILIGFVPETDKTGSIYEAVRIDIGDPAGLIFDDDFLKRVLIKAVRRLNHRLGLSVTDRPKGVPGNFGGQRLKVNPIVADVEVGTITPCNDELIDLIVMQMELIILESELSALKRLTANGIFGSTVGRDGISVTNADNVSVTISTGRLGFRSDLHKFDVLQRRKELEDAIKAFLNRLTGNFSKLIY